jgi:hypothetical protein
MVLTERAHSEGWTCWLEKLILGKLHGMAHRDFSFVIGRGGLRKALEEQASTPKYQQLVIPCALPSLALHSRHELTAYAQSMRARIRTYARPSDPVHELMAKAGRVFEVSHRLFALLKVHTHVSIRRVPYEKGANVQRDPPLPGAAQRSDSSSSTSSAPSAVSTSSCRVRRPPGRAAQAERSAVFKDYLRTFAGRSIGTEEFRKHLYDYFRRTGGQAAVAKLDSIDWDVRSRLASLALARH